MANSPCSGGRRVVSRAARSAAVLAGLTVCIGWPAFADNTDITNKPAVADKADKSHGADSWGHFLDVANPYASAEFANDSNIYRLDDIQTVNEIIPPVPGRSDQRGDQYVTLAAGFDADIRSGQQQYGLLGEINTTRYDHHSEIDYDGGKAAAVWHWTANELLTGTAGYRFSRTLRNFSNQLAPRRDIDVRTENRVFASADRDLPDNWKLGVRGDYADVAFSSTTSLDLHRATGGASLSYVSQRREHPGVRRELYQRQLSE